jgi:FMN phosphatase YigB (HAD superfamily)
MTSAAVGILSELGAESTFQSSGTAGIAGVVFDVPDVFYDATLWRRWLFRLLVRISVASDYSQFQSRWEYHLADVHRGRRELGEALQTLLLELGASWAQIDEVEAASRIQRQKFEVDVRPLPGVLSTVRALNELRIPLIAWADAPLTSAKLAERLERLLPRVEFQNVITSIEVECSQPDPHSYRIMCDAIAAPGSKIYVGHDPVHLVAAHQAGLMTAALSYLPAGDVDFPLSSLEDLAAVVSRCQATSQSSRTRQGECR